jgi:hypothetical protein
MQSLFDYILKLSVSLAIVYVFYQLVLRKLTFYNWNRWYLLGYTAFAFLIPVMDITKTLNQAEWNQSVILQYIPIIEVNNGVNATQVMAHRWTALDWLFVLLLAGMLVLIVKFAIRYLSFLKVRRDALLLADGDTKLYMVDKDIIPFSFGNNIFINNQLQDEAELKEIIRHEFVHVKQKHTHDIIWSELLCILNWYNPFVWLIRKAIRQNLEFIADNKVLEQGFDKKKYQYLLLKVTGNNHFSIANQFNFSSLKKRIAMMNKMKSPRAQLVKFLFIVPLIAVMLLAFRNERSRNNNQNNTLASWQKDFTDSVPDQPPPPPPPPTRPPMPPAPPADIKLPANVKNPPPPQQPPQGFNFDIAPRTAIDTLNVMIQTPSAIAPVNEVVVVRLSAKPTVATAIDVNTAIVPVKEVIVTGYSIRPTVATTIKTAISPGVVIANNELAEVVAVGHTITRAGVQGEKELELKIYKSTTRERLDQLIAEADAKGVDLNFSKIEYDNSGKLTRLAGKMEKGNCKNNFSLSDFEVLTLVVTKNNGQYNCMILANNQKEVQ